jgi:hypothetical protein
VSVLSNRYTPYFCKKLNTDRSLHPLQPTVPSIRHNRVDSIRSFVQSKFSGAQLEKKKICFRWTSTLYYSESQNWLLVKGSHKYIQQRFRMMNLLVVSALVSHLSLCTSFMVKKSSNSFAMKSDLIRMSASSEAQYALLFDCDGVIVETEVSWDS